MTPKTKTTKIEPTTDEKIAALREDVDNLVATMKEMVPILEAMTNIVDNLADIDTMQHMRLNMVENKESNQNVLD